MTNLMERPAIFRDWLPTARKVHVARSIANLDFKTVHSVLVIGAGGDPYRQYFPGAHRYIRLDIACLDGNIDLLADAVALPFLASCFDCVIATEVLEYVRQPVMFVAEIHRVLCEGGLSVVTVPFLFNSHLDYWRPTVIALRELFARFSSVAVKAQGTRVLTIWDLITTSFWPWPVLMPLRIFSNLLYLLPNRVICRDSKSSAPGGYIILARR